MVLLFVFYRTDPVLDPVLYSVPPKCADEFIP